MASGNYSTTIGRKNSTSGAQSFTGGSNNTNKGDNTIMFGSGNQNTTAGDYGVILGHTNNNNGRNDMIIIGASNTANSNSQYGIILGSANSGICYFGIMLGTNLKSQNYTGVKLIGDNLTAKHGNQMILGRYNAATSSLTDPHIILACGVSENDKKNALEIDGTEYKILNNLQLATDTTAVNAITPYRDPNNVTADDQTLTTKSYVGAILPAFTLRSEKLLEYTDVSQAPTVPTDGTSLDFSPIIPAWAKHIWVYFKWEGESYTEDIMVDVNNGVHLDAQQYDTTQPLIARLEHDHVRMDYNATNKTLTAIDFWYYDHDINTNTISNIDTTLSDCPPIYVMSVIATA